MILNPIDQNIRDQGFNFVPFNRFLASPFQIPIVEDNTSEARVSAGLPTLVQPRGGGGGGEYAASLGLGPGTSGFIGNFQNINPNEMYSMPMSLEDIDPNNFEESYAQFEKDQLKGQPVPGEDIPAINFKDAPVDFMLRANNPRVFDPIVNVKNAALQGVDKIKSSGAQIAGGIMSAATGIPFIGPVLQGITSQFENRPLGAAVIDEFGNVYDEDELNSMNALGGYYTDPARSARRRTSRINKMLERQRLGKKISIKNLEKLQAQERAQEAIRQAAANRMQAQNRAAGTGGYQSSFAQDRDFMDGPSGASTGLGPSDKGGSDTMGSFMDGGIVDLVDIYD